MLVRVELRKSVDTRAGRWLLGLTLVTSLGTVILYLIFGQSDEHRCSDFLYTSQVPMIFVLPVLGILSMTSEWSQRTALQTFALVPDRSRVLRSKVLGLISLVVLLVAASVVAATIATAIAALGNGGGAGPLASAIGRVLLFDSLAILTGAGFGLALLNAPAAIVGFFVLPTLFTALVSLISALSDPVMWLNWAENVTALLGDDLTGHKWAKLVVSVLAWGFLPLAVGRVRVLRRDVQ